MEDYMKLGNLYATRKVEALMHENRKFSDDIHTALNKYIHNDWSDTCPEDVEVNNISINQDGRILAVYETIEGRIWIITDEYRTSTTILFPSEY